MSILQNQKLGREAWNNGQEHMFLRATSWGHLLPNVPVKPYSKTKSFVSMKQPRVVWDVSLPMEMSSAEHRHHI